MVRINILKKNYCILPSFQKMAIIMKIGRFKNLSFNKLSKNIKMCPCVSMKKNQKYLDGFSYRKLNLKVRFWHFLLSSSARQKSSLFCILWKLDNPNCHNIGEWKKNCCWGEQSKFQGLFLTVLSVHSCNSNFSPFRSSLFRQ